MAEQIIDPGREREPPQSRQGLGAATVARNTGIMRRKSLGETVGNSRSAPTASDTARMELFKASKSWKQVAAEKIRWNKQFGSGVGGNQVGESPSAGPVVRPEASSDGANRAPEVPRMRVAFEIPVYHKDSFSMFFKMDLSTP